MSEIEAMQRNIRSVKALNQHYADMITRHIEEATQRFIESGLAPAAAKKMAEKCVVNALNGIAEENFRGPKRVET